jgi:hypothetical protein
VIPILLSHPPTPEQRQAMADYVTFGVLLGVIFMLGWIILCVYEAPKGRRRNACFEGFAESFWLVLTMPLFWPFVIGGVLLFGCIFVVCHLLCFRGV